MRDATWARSRRPSREKRIPKQVHPSAPYCPRSQSWTCYCSGPFCGIRDPEEPLHWWPLQRNRRERGGCSAQRATINSLRKMHGHTVDRHSLDCAPNTRLGMNLRTVLGMAAWVSDDVIDLGCLPEYNVLCSALSCQPTSPTCPETAYAAAWNRGNIINDAGGH